VNRAELIEAVAQEVALPKARVAAVVEVLVGKIGDALASGERVEIHGLGIFTTTICAAKKGRNPATGEPVDVPAARVVKFKPARSVKATVAQAG